MAKVKFVQIMAVRNDGYERWEYLDDKGRLWTVNTVHDKFEYDEQGKPTKSIYKDVWKEIDLPDEPSQHTTTIS